MGRLKGILVGFASSLGGEYTERHRRVVTPAEQWTIVLDGRPARGDGSYHVFGMRANYISLDGFEFKVERKRLWHDLFGRIFGSRDIDIAGGGQWQREYCVEGNDDDRVRDLFSNQMYFENLRAWAEELKRYISTHSEFSMTVKKKLVEVRIIEDRDAAGVVHKLVVAHNLVAETLRALVAMGSASPEGLEPED